MKVIVTGAKGNVGSEVTEHCEACGDEILPFDSTALDITNRGHVLRVLEEERPDVVINCSAWTDVDGCEVDANRNYSVNAQGVKNLAVTCKATATALITISTDFVFSGSKQGFYTQDDEPGPINAYGVAKLQGEQLAQTVDERVIIVRAGWIFGSRGKNFLSKVGQMLAGGQAVKAIGDSFGTPTYARDLAKRLRELAVLSTPGIYHVANDGPGVSYAEFARAAADDPEQVIDISAESLRRPARRPRNTRLRCLRSEGLGLAPLRYWSEALQDHLHNLA